MATEKRLIDANDAEKFAREHIFDANERFLILDFLRECSTVDAVEVVRCKDCKYYCQDKINGAICRHPELDYEIECYDHWINTNPDDFCSYGERKDGDGNG